MAVYLSPLAVILQYFSNVGVPLAGGTVTIYEAGTSTAQATYTDSTGTVANANPITLNSAGRLGNVSIWQPSGIAIKAVIADQLGNTIATLDQLQGINDIAIAESALADPASGSGADLVANAVRSYSSFNEARSANTPSLASGQTLVVIFEGGNAVDDGLGGDFYWDASSVTADDGLNVIAPNGAATGRYLRVASINVDLTAVKVTTSSVTSSTSVAADSELKATLSLPGTYSLEFWLNDSGGSSAGGLKGAVAFSGTSTAGAWAMNGNGGDVTTVPLTALGTAVEMQSAQAGTASMKIDGFVTISTSGVISFNWAQETSNGTPSVLSPGSWMRVKLLSTTGSGFEPVTHLYSSGSGTETIPPGATTLTVEVFGASGAGGNEWTDNQVFPPATAPGTGGGSGGLSRSVFNVSGKGGETLAYSVGAPGSATTVSSGTFSLSTMTANSGGGGTSASSPGGTAGTASGGTAVNVSGTAGGWAAGGSGVVGLYASGAPGGYGGIPLGAPGSNGLIVFRYV